MSGIKYTEEDERNFVLSMKNIRKNSDGKYYLEDNWYQDENGKWKYKVGVFQCKKQCDICSHARYTAENSFGSQISTCAIIEELTGTKNAVTTCVMDCDAYDEVKTLNVINNMDDMIVFMKRCEYFFSCPENFESYFGISRKWDEFGTGEILETIEEYYNRGGKFEECPDRFPAVIRFDLNCHGLLEWIYIGD